MDVLKDLGPENRVFDMLIEGLDIRLEMKVLDFVEERSLEEFLD
jgi:hypothetical protein